ncbi:MAG: hypothetical protein JSU94_03735, partial [Phycisphaerales bacterium]
MCRKLILFSLIMVLAASGSAVAKVPGWWNEDVGSPTPGDATKSGSTYTITGNGHDIWDQSDNFHYLYKQLTGDGEIIARVVSVGTGSNAWCKGGVMIRQDNTGPSQDAYMIITGGNGGGASFQHRPTYGANAVYSGGDTSPAVAAPYWVKIVRTGNVFSGFLSPDGVAWAEADASPQTVNMTDPVLIGLCVTSHAAGELRTMTFDNVSYSGNVTDKPPQLKAWDPVPASGSENVGKYENYGLLQWKAGETAAWHRVYYGRDPVLGAADFKQRSPLASIYYFPTDRVAGTTYYWRIDEEESGGAIITGDTWWFSTAPREAHTPNPSDGSMFVDPNIDLSWGSGFDATSHDVYFGTDATAVANATTATAGIYKGNVAANLYELDPLGYDTDYYWRIDEKEAAETVKGDVWTFRTGTTKQGKVVYELWENISGVNLDALKNNFNYPDNPSQSGELTTFSYQPNLDNYGGRIHGWLHVPSAGDYTFWVAGDDNTELWLSTDEDPGNVELIANIPGWTGFQAFDTIASQQSETMTLTPGKYYIMALWKEGGGGDHCAAAWQGPPSPERSVIPGAYLSPYEALWAWAPKPADDATGVSKVTTLTWQPGIHATGHKVYFGTDATAVANANEGSGEYKGPRALGAESFDPGPLTWATSYYWRIDEVNNLHAESPWVGSVWSFTVADYLIVDDFEDYNDYPPDRIFEWWLDGFGYGA